MDTKLPNTQSAVHNGLRELLTNGIEPYAYLRTVFERIAEHPINRIDELLPWHLMPVEQPVQQAA